MRALTNFEEVYAVYFDDVYRYLLSLSGSESVAEELTSETFFRAMDALDHLQELVLDGKSVRIGELGLFSMGMTSRAEDSRAEVTAQSIQGVHLILRNTRTWSNSELSKKCKLQEYGTYDASADDADGDNGGSTPSQGGGSTSGGSTSGGSTSDGSSSGSGSNSGDDGYNEL